MKASRLKLVNIIVGLPSTVTHYATLIGIDSYLDKPLKSCVNDIQETKIFFEGTLKDFIKIQAITASQADRKPSDPAQDPMVWLTRKNVTLAFERVTSLARTGDFMYIHYFKHSTQKPPSDDFSNKSTSDLALVFLSRGKENRRQYF